MIGSGEFTVEVNGKIIGFRFGMLASGYTEIEAQKGIFKVFEDIATGHGTLAIIQYFYGGLKAYNKFKKINDEVSVEIMSELIEEIGYDKIMSMYLESIAQYLPKNGKAPIQTGPVTSE